jgi:uncharacterized protein YecE (DUF72 family)
MTAHLGTSGWYYDHWVSAFYPESFSKRKWLEYYAQDFDTVEVNSTFYHPAKEKTLQGWHERTPDNFVFALKGAGFITHRKKLQDVEEPLKNFYGQCRMLKGKMGPVLFQLPPSMHKDTGRLENFLRLLDKYYRYAVEFRHESWFCDEVYDLLRKYRVACCVVSAPGVAVRVRQDCGRLRVHTLARSQQLVLVQLHRG